MTQNLKVERIPAIALQLRMPHAPMRPKADVIAAAKKAGKLAAETVLHNVSREYAKPTLTEDDGYLEFTAYSDRTGLQHRTAQLVVDTFCDAYDAAIEAARWEHVR